MNSNVEKKKKKNVNFPGKLPNSVKIEIVSVKDIGFKLHLSQSNCFYSLPLTCYFTALECIVIHCGAHTALNVVPFFEILLTSTPHPH